MTKDFWTLGGRSLRSAEQSTHKTRR
uniref:Uncharacterized protein n=1 Tax=Anguilla anguilla TaxID=7936 RepID=A0A0E9TJF6_ANGAN